MEGFLALVGVILIGFILFCIYFIFKQIQFVLVSVNLYKKMVNRQDAMVKLLLDIRDKTKKYDTSSPCSALIEEDEVEEDSPKTGESEEAGPDFCYYCGAENPDKLLVCPSCGKRYD